MSVMRLSEVSLVRKASQPAFKAVATCKGIRKREIVSRPQLACLVGDCAVNGNELCVAATDNDIGKDLAKLRLVGTIGCHKTLGQSNRRSDCRQNIRIQTVEHRFNER